MRVVKEWRIEGFPDTAREKIDKKLMEDTYSSWFSYKGMPWYRKRRLKGNSPKITIETALKELQIDANIWRKEEWKQIASYWVIEPPKEI